MASRPTGAPTTRCRLLATVASLAMVATACSDDPEVGAPAPDGPAAPDRAAEVLTVMARDPELTRPLFTLFEQETGITVQARYGNPIELADQVIVGGAPADVYYGPLSDALGSLSAAGRLAPLSEEQLGRVPEAYQAPDGGWVGISGRVSVVFYNTDRLSEDDLPDSILGFTDPAWRRRIGWDPVNRSLQAVVGALRQVEGEEEARAWLAGVQANEPAVFTGQPPIVDAVAAGEIVEVGIGNHYYLYEPQSDGDAMNVAAKFYPGDPGGLLNVAGVGIIEGTTNEAAANALVDFLLSPTAQQYVAGDHLEVPLVEGVDPPEGVPTVDQLTVRGLDVRRLEELADAVALLREVGVIM